MAHNKIDTDRLISMLMTSTTHLSGADIAARLGVTRAAIWKAIHHLQDEGYLIEASKPKGYKLLGTPDLCIPELTEALKHNSFVTGHNIVYHQNIPSTNTLAMELAAAGCADGTLVIADSQSSGKGRLGRTWISPAGKNLYMSLVIRPNIPPRDAPSLTLLAAVACASALRTYAGVEAMIKWPNDLLVNGKKIGGILTEIKADMDTIAYAVIGIGLNINISADEIPAEIRDIATSVYAESGRQISRTAMASALIGQFDLQLANMLLNGKQGILDEWTDMSCTLGNRVRVVVADRAFEGTAEAIDDEGLLIVLMPDGSRMKFSAGDVTILRSV